MERGTAYTVPLLPVNLRIPAVENLFHQRQFSGNRLSGGAQPDEIQS